MSGIAVVASDWERLCRHEPRLLQVFLQKLYARAARNLLHSNHQHRPVLEEAVLEGFRIFLEKLDQTEDASMAKAEAFAYGIVRRTYFHLLRRERRQSRRPDDTPDFPNWTLPSDPTYTSAGDLFADLGHDRLYHWYQRLHEEHQGCLDLRIQGYDQKEIAELLGRRHGTIRNWMSRLMREARGVVR